MFLNQSTAPRVISTTVLALLICVLIATAPGLAVVVGIGWWLYHRSVAGQQARHEETRKQNWGF